MASQEPETLEWTPERTYLAMGFASLGLLFVFLQTRGVDVGALSIAVVGSVGLLSCAYPGTDTLASMTLAVRRVVPGIVLLLLTVALFEPARFRRLEQPGLDPSDFVFVASALAFFAAFYRLCGLVGPILPVDHRSRNRPPASGLEVRPISLVDDNEIGGLGIMILGSTALGMLLWFITRGAVPKEVPAELGRILVLIWMIGVTGVLAAGLIDVARQRTRTPEQAQQLLYDELWKDTLREQQRCHRWQQKGRQHGQGDDP